MDSPSDANLLDMDKIIATRLNFDDTEECESKLGRISKFSLGLDVDEGLDTSLEDNRSDRSSVSPPAKIFSPRKLNFVGSNMDGTPTHVGMDACRDCNENRKSNVASRPLRISVGGYNPENTPDGKYGHSPPYKRVKALKLFDSPHSPLSLLNKQSENSNNNNTISETVIETPKEEPKTVWETPKPMVCTRSRLFNKNSDEKSKSEAPAPSRRFTTIRQTRRSLNVTPDEKDDTPSCNVNPFNNNGFSSRKRTRSKRSLNG